MLRDAAQREPQSWHCTNARRAALLLSMRPIESGSFTVSPRRLGEDDRLGARQIARRDADKLAVLPLPHAPLLAADVSLEIDRPDDGLVGSAVCDGVEHLLAV